MSPATGLASRTHRALAFGLRWESDLPLSRFEPVPADGSPADIVVRQATAPLRTREVVIGFGGAALCTDGIRYDAGEEGTFDTIGADRVEWLPGKAWTGAFPETFYGTLTALLLGWRGWIPVHGTAVDVGGRAVLVCGPSGSGKSTLGAALIARGARLISDDLSVVAVPEGGDAGLLYAGRPAMRLFPSIAGYLSAAGPGVGRGEAAAGGKEIVHPPRVASLEPIPLESVIILGSPSATAAPADAAALLHANLFRPRWMANIPGYAERSSRISRMAKSLRVVSMPGVGVRDAWTFAAQAAVALEMIGARTA